MHQDDLIAEGKEFFEFQKKEIGKSAKERKKSVEVNFLDLATHSHHLTEMLLLRPEETLRSLEIALNGIGLIANAKVRIVGLPEEQKIALKDIRAKSLGMLVYMDCILQSKGEVLPCDLSAKFECPSCGLPISISQVGKHFRQPMKCTCGKRGNFKLISRDTTDMMEIRCRDIRTKQRQRIDIRKISVFGEDLVEKVESIPEGSKIRLIGIPFIEEEISGQRNLQHYSFKVQNIRLLEKAEELEMALIKNETQLRDFLYKYPYYIEEGLIPVDIEKSFNKIEDDYGIIPAGKADLIFQDKNDKPLIVELKIDAHSKDVKQLLRYAKAFLKENPMNPSLVRKMIGCLSASSGLSKFCKEKGIELKILKRIRKTTKKDVLVDIPISMQPPFKKPSREALYELEQQDINRVATSILPTHRDKITLVRNIIKKLELKLGKLVPIEKIKEELNERIGDKELEEIIDLLTRAGEIFRPKVGHVQII